MLVYTPEYKKERNKLIYNYFEKSYKKCPLTDKIKPGAIMSICGGELQPATDPMYTGHSPCEFSFEFDFYNPIIEQEDSMIKKTEKHMMKLSSQGFKTFKLAKKILSWKDGFRFYTTINEGEENVKHWWKAVTANGLKSGELFDTLEEAELSAFVCFCNHTDIIEK